MKIIVFRVFRVFLWYKNLNPLSPFNKGGIFNYENKQRLQKYWKTC